MFCSKGHFSPLVRTWESISREPLHSEPDTGDFTKLLDDMAYEFFQPNRKSEALPPFDHLIYTRAYWNAEFRKKRIIRYMQWVTQFGERNFQRFKFVSGEETWKTDMNDPNLYLTLQSLNFRPLGEI